MLCFVFLCVIKKQVMTLLRHASTLSVTHLKLFSFSNLGVVLTKREGAGVMGGKWQLSTTWIQV